MKNNKIALIISLVALTGVILLLIVQLSGKPETKTEEPEKETTSKSKIAYVNIDSASSRYDLFNALSLQFTKKQNDLQQELQSKMMSLQNRANQLQNQYAQHTITSQKYQQQAERLSNEQMQLQKWQEQKMLELNEDQLSLNERVYDSLVSVINYINKDKKYDLIIANSTAGAILYGNPQWDITDQVVQLLNKRAKDGATTDTTTQK